MAIVASGCFLVRLRIIPSKALAIDFISSFPLPGKVWNTSGQPDDDLQDFMRFMLE
jgi:hypothetical protein